MIGVAQVIGTKPNVSLVFSRFFIASCAISCKEDNGKTVATAAKALDTLLERVHQLDAEVAKARENAKPVVEDAYKVPRIKIEE